MKQVSWRRATGLAA